MARSQNKRLCVRLLDVSPGTECGVVVVVMMKIKTMVELGRKKAEKRSDEAIPDPS